MRSFNSVQGPFLGFGHQMGVGAQGEARVVVTQVPGHRPDRHPSLTRRPPSPGLVARFGRPDECGKGVGILVMSFLIRERECQFEDTLAAVGKVLQVAVHQARQLT